MMLHYLLTLVLLFAVSANSCFAVRPTASTAGHADQEYLDYAKQPQFDAVVRIDDAQGLIGSAVMLSSHIGLTTSSAVRGADNKVLEGLSIKKGAKTIAIKSVFDNPLYDSRLLDDPASASSDMALFVLDQPVGNVSSFPVLSLLKPEDLTGAQVSVCGFGSALHNDITYGSFLWRSFSNAFWGLFSSAREIQRVTFGLGIKMAGKMFVVGDDGMLKSSPFFPKADNLAASIGIGDGGGPWMLKTQNGFQVLGVSQQMLLSSRSIQASNTYESYAAYASSIHCNKDFLLSGLRQIENISTNNNVKQEVGEILQRMDLGLKEGQDWLGAFNQKGLIERINPEYKKIVDSVFGAPSTQHLKQLVAKCWENNARFTLADKLWYRGSLYGMPFGVGAFAFGVIILAYGITWWFNYPFIR